MTNPENTLRIFLNRHDGKFKLGTLGELAAEKHLIQQEYTIIQKNWRTRSGEIDIIAKPPDSTCIATIEVKTRSTHVCGTPIEAVSRRKLQRLRMLARLWALSVNSPLPTRIDLLAVDVSEDNRIRFTHIRGIGS